jgi:uncharacterized protein (DUF58 family)
MIDTKELMKQVGRLRILTNRLVDQHLTGAYHSVFKGQGIEFDEVREYAFGDDVRSIDWNVTARMGHPYIKRFAEERELTVMFLVDISGSQCFGSLTRSKAQTAAEITCLLALSAIKNQDNIGLILFSDRIEKSIPPRKGRTAAMRLVREVLAAEETPHGTDIAGALHFLTSVQKRKAVVFLISDFQDTGYESALRVAARRHDVICCPITDPHELELPDVGLVEIEDAETGDLFLADTGSSAFRNHFTRESNEHADALKRLFTRNSIDQLDLSTDRPVIDEVRRLFRRRQVRSKNG